MDNLNTPWVIWGLVVFSVFIGIGCIAASLRYLRRRRLIDDIPTSKTTGVFIGLVELKGTAETESLLTSRLAKSICVWYKWTVEEKWSRTVATGRGGTRTETGWTTVASGGEEPAFYLKDDLGVIRVLPQGAEVEAAGSFDKTCGRNDALYYSEGPKTAIANSTHTRRYRETVIPLHAAIYLIGKSRQRQDIVAAEIAAEKGAEMFLISTREEKKISSGYRTGEWVTWLSGLILCPGALVVRQKILETPVPEIVRFGLIAAGIYFGLWFVSWFLTVFNSVVSLRNRVRQAWANVDVELKRRADLIPNLVSMVQGYAQHESSTLESVAELRSRQETSGNTLTGCAPTVRILAEKYPDLKADTVFVNLQKSLIETEQRIALSRSYYNDIATFFNTRLQVIPDSVIGGIGGLRRTPLYAARELEKAVVSVHLAG